MKKIQGNMKTQKLFASIFGTIAILVGLIAIVKIVVIKELVVGILSLTIGIMAIIWTYKARRSLSEGSELRNYTTYFLLCLISILLFSIWDTFISFLQVQSLRISDFFLYPKYIFITIAYLIFLRAAYQILYLSKKFGFSEEAKDIQKLLEVKKKKQA